MCRKFLGIFFFKLLFFIEKEISEIGRENGLELMEENLLLYVFKKDRFFGVFR